MKFYFSRYKKIICVGILSFILGYIFSIISNNVQNVFGYINEYDYDVIVLILSSPNNFRQRNTIRRTWVQSKNNINYKNFDMTLEYMDVPNFNNDGFLIKDSVDLQRSRLIKFKSKIESSTVIEENKTRRGSVSKVKYLFCIGLKDLPTDIYSNIVSENARHHDLLLLPNFKDSYEFLTEKVIESFASITEGYNFKYVLKSDDDSYVKLNNIIEELKAYDENLGLKYENQDAWPQLYWGYFNGAAKVKLLGQWAETEWFVCDRYLPYALGGGYVLSQYLVKYIAENGHILSKYRSEDVSVGMWLAPLRHVYRRHDPRFNTEWRPREFNTMHVVIHKITPEVMDRLWAETEKEQSENTKKSIDNVGYFYNWYKNPSKCCL